MSLGEKSLLFDQSAGAIFMTDWAQLLREASCIANSIIA